MASERRLIDANALIEWIDMGHLRNPLETCFSERDVVDMLESRQTEDTVEVVRCRDCMKGTKQYREYPNKEREERYLCRLDGELWKPQDFCSYGERRTDG